MSCPIRFSPLALGGLLFLAHTVASAANLDPAGGPRVGRTANGAALVDIAAPNAAGLSHNRFERFDVGREGLILNNSAGPTQTQLGGSIAGNAQLGGAAARRILLEVSGGSRSQLQGYTEVAGRAAQVIVANPNGITCNGCGFLNAPRVTLSTARPRFDGARLQGYEVDGGDILVEGAGLDARQVERFELITRSAVLNATLQAQQLDIVAGRNRVDAETLAVVAKADTAADKPRLAIDSTALGGMYANAIRLVGTERGVGVRLAGDLAASAGDIRIDSDGRLQLARVQAAGHVQARASEMSLEGALSSGADIELSSGAGLRNGGSVDSAGRLALRVGGGLDNRAGQLRAQDIELNVAGALDNGAGLIDSRGRLALGAATLSNADGQIRARGRDGSAVLQVAGLLDNGAGVIDSAARDLQLSSGELRNAGGSVNHSGSGAFGIDLRQLGLAGGRFVTRSSLTIALDEWTNRSQLQARELTLDIRRLEQEAGGKLLAQLDLRGRGGDWRNAGQIVSEGNFALSLSGRYSGGGRLASQERFQLSAESLQLARGAIVDGGASTRLEVRGELDNQGTLTAWGELWVNAARLVNRGTLGSHERLHLEVAELDNQGGTLFDRDGPLPALPL